MQTVKVKRTELLKKLIFNRAKHVAEYERAKIGYRRAAERKLVSALNQVRKRASFKLHLTLEEPSNCSSWYDRAIAMLKMSVEETIDLSSGEFEQYVMDNWSWKQVTVGTNAFYAKLAK